MDKGDRQKIVIDLATDVSIYASSIMLGLIIGYAIGVKSIIASLTLVGTISPIIIAFTATALEVFDKMRSRFRVEALKAEGREEGREEGKEEGKEERTSEVLDILKKHNINGDALREIEALSNQDDK